METGAGANPGALFLNSIPSWTSASRNAKRAYCQNIQSNSLLIFEPHETPIPTNPSGQYLWCEIKGVEMEEIVDYHK